jgi:N-methylhydantoinase B
MISTSMKNGERIYHRQAGGGGFGDPLRRDPERVAHDVRNERVSLEAAREQYGVILDAGTGTVATAATAALRQERRSSPAKRES